MKQSKKVLSFLLALVIGISASSVGFFAFAQDTEQTNPVTIVEQEIDTWYSTHRNNMYSTKEADADKKAAAREAYDDINSKIKNLTDAQTISIDLAHYGYWLAVVSIDISRNNSSNPTKTPSTAEKCDVFQNNLSDMEDIMGAFPKEYKEVFDAFKPFTVKAGTYLGDTSKINFQNNDAAVSLLDELISNIKKLSYSGLLFSDYLTPANTGGFYVSSTSVRAVSGTTVGNLLKLLYAKNQDMMTASGKDPTFTYGNYVARTGSYGNYTYAWKAGKTAQNYVDDFNTYYAAYQTDIVEPSEKTYQDIYEIYSVFSQYQGIAEVAEAITAAGTKIIKNETVTSAEVKAAIEKYNNLSATAKSFYDSIASRSDSKLLPYANNQYTVDTITPTLAYTKSSSVSSYKLSDLLKKCNDFLNDLLLQEFVEYIEKTDLNKKTDKIIKAAQEQYAALPSAFKSKIPDETLAKFMELVKPDVDMSDLSAQVKAFKQTKVTLPKNSPLANEEGGIQYAVDQLWDLVAKQILPLVANDLKLSQGLDPILKSKVYTNEMVSKIFSLYAMLSHDESIVVESPKLSLGTVIGMIASPTNIAKMLEEEKFAVAAEKVKAYSSFKDTAEMNKFDALAAEKFENGDFGFQDGDREGFFNALLAVLRPITTLLAPGAKAAGIVAINANMFDYVTDEGEYVEGAYAKLIPLLEQIGLTSLPTTAEYKKNYYDTVKSQSTYIAADKLVSPIIDSLLTDVLDMVSPDPLNGLIKVLPRLAYVISSDMVNDCVKNALGQLGMLSGLAGSLDLSSKAIDNMITGAPIDLTSLAGTECKIQLKPIDWKTLANCATVKSVKSVSNSNAYFVLRTGDTQTCFTTVFYYVYSVAFADSENYSAIKNLLNSKLGTVGGIVTGITDGFAGKTPIEGYEQFLNFFKAPRIELPEIKPIPEITITGANKIDASKCTAKLSCKTYNYNAKAHKPSVTVKYGNKTLKNGTDYTVTYLGNCTNTGKHAVLVVFKGEYTGSKYLYFNIKPKATTIKSVSAGKKSFTVKWNKKSSQITGYQIQYSTSKNFKNAKTITVNSTSAESKKISKLKAKKKYYVRVRTYKYLCGVKTYSTWSKAKTVTTKK